MLLVWVSTVYAHLFVHQCRPHLNDVFASISEISHSVTYHVHTLHAWQVPYELAFQVGNRFLYDENDIENGMYQSDLDGYIYIYIYIYKIHNI